MRSGASGACGWPTTRSSRRSAPSTKPCSEDGLDAEWLEDLPGRLATLFRGAIVHPSDGSLQPARWVRRLAARAAEAGAQIVEDSRIESLD